MTITATRACSPPREPVSPAFTLHCGTFASWDCLLLTDLVTLELVRFGVRAVRRGFTRLVRSVFRLALLALVVFVAFWLVRQRPDLQPAWLRALTAAPPPMTPSIHLDEQVRAALGRVVHAKDAGGPPDAEDRFLLLRRYSAWLEALEEHFAPVRCSACGGVLPECGLLNHTLRCSRMPPVARAAQLDAELRALEEVADLLGRPLDLAANPTLAGPGPDRPPAKHAGVLRREVSGALRLLRGGNVDRRDALNQRAIGRYEPVAIPRLPGSAARSKVHQSQSPRAARLPTITPLRLGGPFGRR